MNLNPTRICGVSLRGLPAAKSVEDFEALLPWDTTRDH
jgi:hypothetical protein